jgi:hypothetical protein
LLYCGINLIKNFSKINLLFLAQRVPAAAVTMHVPRSAKKTAQYCMYVPIRTKSTGHILSCTEKCIDVISNVPSANTN